jgi:hypothetical protein
VGEASAMMVGESSEVMVGENSWNPIFCITWMLLCRGIALTRTGVVETGAQQTALGIIGAGSGAGSGLAWRVGLGS